MKIIRVLAGAFFGLLLVTAAPAAAQDAQYPITTTTTAQGQGQTVSDSSPSPGETITVSGGGFAPSTAVTVTFDTQVLGTTQTRSDGTFSTQVTIPSNASAGQHTIASTGTGANGATRRLTSTVNVLGATAARGTLPRTGTGLTTPLAASAALLIGAGAVAVVATRRRRA